MQEQSSRSIFGYDFCVIHFPVGYSAICAFALKGSSEIYPTFHPALLGNISHRLTHPSHFGVHSISEYQPRCPITCSGKRVFQVLITGGTKDAMCPRSVRNEKFLHERGLNNSPKTHGPTEYRSTGIKLQLTNQD